MNFVHCNLCGRNKTEVVNQGADLHLDIAGSFTLVRCQNCGLIYQNPQLSQEELAVHYPDEYMAYHGSKSTESLIERSSRMHATNRFCEHVIKRHPENGRLLDIGCATGEFLYGMKNRGWQVQGVEPSNYAAQIAREHFGLDVQVGTLTTIEYPNNYFDVVSMWDVLEHVTDPYQTLQEIQRILRPGGLFVASIPNLASIEARIFGASWLGWDRPRHLHLFTIPVLQQYLSKTGFQWAGQTSFNGRLYVTLLSINYWLTARGMPKVKSNAWIQFLYNLPLRTITWPIYKLAELTNKTTVTTIFATAL